MVDKTNKPDKRDETLAEIIARQGPAAAQRLNTNMSEAMAESQRMMQEVMTSQAGAMGTMGDMSEHPVAIGSGNSLARVGHSLAMHPQRMADANLSLWQGYMELWQDFVLGRQGERGRDRRFADPEWTANPVFDFMRRSYELNTNWLMSLIDQADDIGEHDRRKARFMARQTVDAFAPTNFFATNPAALKAMMETAGESVLSGIRQAREDLQRGEGKLSISQTDETPFKVGENIATAPGEVVYRNTLIELIQYAPTRKTAHEIPLVIFPPWINKFYILDLREENSMIRWLVDQGLTVFVVSWRSADDETKDYNWDDYVENGIFAALDAVQAETGAEEVNTVGYCIGGTLLTSALAWMARHDDTRVRSATFFASQSDFEQAGDLLVFTDTEAVEQVSAIIESHDGIMPGSVMLETFNWLRPVDLVWRYVVDNYMMGKKPRPFDLLYWNADQTNIPGPTHLTYLRELYGHNALSRGQFKVRGETVHISDITIPVTVQSSRDDHICPCDSVYRTAQAFGGETRFILAGSGHIAGVINHPDAGKYQHWINDGPLAASLQDWLGGAEEISGSWWPSWMAWLKPLSGRRTSAPEPDDKGLGAAPGFYVTVRLEDIDAARAEGATPTPPPQAKPTPRPKPKTKTTAQTSSAQTSSGQATAAQERASPAPRTTGAKPDGSKASATKAGPSKKTAGTKAKSASTTSKTAAKGKSKTAATGGKGSGKTGKPAGSGKTSGAGKGAGKKS